MVPEEEEMAVDYAFRKAVQGFEIDGKVSALLLPNDEGFDEETLGGFKKGLEEMGDSSIAPPVFLVYCCADLFRLMVDDVFNELSESLLEDVHEVYDEYDKPSDEEWVKIETFSKLVGCIYKVAVELFEGGYSTSNVYFHLLAELKVILEKELEGADSDYFRCKAKGMLKRFDKYWNQMFLVLASACVLDPRFKLKYVEFYCWKKIENDEGSNAETVLDYLRSLYARYAASDICHKPICPVTAVDSKEEDENDDGEGEDCDEEQEEEDCDEGQEGEEEDYEDEEEEEDYEDEEQEGEEKYDSDSSEEAEREAGKNREKNPDACKDFAFFQEFLKFEGSSPREFGESELDAYLKEPVMEWNKDFKALEWWREDGGHKYPILSRVARDILSIPISRVTSYDAYVTGKREPPAFVVSLEAKVANAMMCSKKWLRL
ncbi:hypothetical protein F2Q69_00031359 [Brassica cretica]|uniref:HAT C-terminal dimerisation domain-containing protein n=1 Tax=Brassica cretica TaxID=69181 RepID=A0A8S9S6V2_BRACR|nr:hypothetical protein F2Q69_00031359 [Brassica cretica]